MSLTNLEGGICVEEESAASIASVRAVAGAASGAVPAIRVGLAETGQLGWTTQGAFKHDCCVRHATVSRGPVLEKWSKLGPASNLLRMSLASVWRPVSLGKVLVGSSRGVDVM